MRIEVTLGIVYAGSVWPAGSVLDVPAEVGAALVKRGEAVEAKAPADQAPADPKRKTGGAKADGVGA